MSINHTLLLIGTKKDLSDTSNYITLINLKDLPVTTKTYMLMYNKFGRLEKNSQSTRLPKIRYLFFFFKLINFFSFANIESCVIPFMTFR